MSKSDGNGAHARRQGYIAAPVLPLRDDGAIDLDTMDAYVRWIAEDGPRRSS